MADEQRILKEDGYLNVATDSSSITYHPSLNVILLFNRKNEVKVLDVNSGVILQSCTLSDANGKIKGKYMALQEKILFWDGSNIGLRGDYNGVLLLDTILQKPVLQNDDLVRLELLLSEGILFQQSLQSLEEHGVECPSDVSNELLDKIKQSQTNTKKGIKAQRWNTICLELPYSSLKLVANNVVLNLKRLDRHIPALAIASAINERLTDLLAGSRVIDTCNSGSFQRFLMYSEAARRHTFEKWPHMDYKWALPDQMAQAGFYHQPSVTGEDRAMCFTCSVCLVCWEKTDEPWSEHERHSPSCPFVKGEYTQNVPLSVTYATNPAISTSGFDVISNSENCNVLCTSDKLGEVTIWSIERQLKKMHVFKIKDHLKDYFPDSSDQFFASLEITAICTLPDRSTESQRGESHKQKSITLKSGILGSKIVVGFFAKPAKKTQLYMAVFDIIDVEEEEGCPEEDATDPKSETAEKMVVDPKAVAVNKPPLEQNLNSDVLQISDFCPWKFNDPKKSDTYSGNFPSLDDDITKIESELKQNTEKLLQTLTQIKSTQTRLPLPEKSEEVSCLPFCLIPVSSEGDELIISEIIPTNNGSNLLVKFSKSCMEEMSDENDQDTYSDICSHLLLYSVDKNGYIKDTPLCRRIFNSDKTPHEICILPLTENCLQKINSSGLESGVFCVVCKDGSLELILLNNFQTIATVARNNERFVSIIYCKSLERLCGCTEKGSLVFYSLHDTDSDSGDEIADEENVNLLTSDGSGATCEVDISEIDGASNSPKLVNQKQQEQLQANYLGGENSSAAFTLLAHKSDLTLADLKALHSLTLFDEMLTPYTAEVPSCWNELVQAQKQRRHPQHLRPGDDTHFTKTWRLHNDATTWDEHVIELTLSKPACLGHIDLKFSLYQQCPNPPAIQVTLLKQNTSGFGYRMKAPNTVNVGDVDDAAVDENVQFPIGGNEGIHENPVLSEEYLQTHNAEILAGPIELASCMDLCDQGGLVTLTSPKLFKTRARNFLLHIKTMVDPSKDGQGKTRVPVRKKGVLRFLFSSLANNPSQNSTNATYSQYSTSTKQSRNDYYIGCDWLHEISITVRSTKNNCNVPNERMQRIAMLESNSFLENLITIICKSSSIMHQNIALDILIWVSTVRLMRFRSPKLSDRSKFRDNDHSQKTASGSNAKDNPIVDMLTQQKVCVSIIEKNLKDIIFNCIINGNRVMSHKAVQLILIVSDAVRNFPSGVQAKNTFDDSLRESITSCLPQLQAAKYASSVRWFTLLVCGTSTSDSHAKISEICTKLLMNVTKEIENRWDPFCSLLGSRFGLYGFPFEPDLFDIDLPQITKSSTSSPNTLVNIIKSNAGLLQPNGMDFKKLSSIDGVEFRSFPHLIKSKSISNQLRGLLEVEPLHFTCFAASEATRIENMDSLTSSTASNINMEDIIVTPLQNNVEGQNDGKNDTEKESMNADVMNNVKNILVDKIFNSTLKKHKVKDDSTETKPNGVVEHLEAPPPIEKSQHSLPKFKAICEYIYESCDENPSDNSNQETKLTNKIQKYLSENNCDENSNLYSWHKLLTAPPKQMVVIERIHSGARRYVVIDFGSPILLTDLVIPACDELASLFVDIWCFDEETDSVRLVVTQDIGTKSLVLSDLQPPPICRYMKITIIGRYGMSATKCKIPIGSFYGHVMILDNDAYADPLLRYMKSPHSNILAQIKALDALYEDVHCRYSLSSSKLMEVLAPILNGELSNLSHMQAFINKQKEEDSSVNNNKIVTIYEECISLQHQLNVIKSVIERLESASVDRKPMELPVQTLQSLSRDKLRVLSESLVEIILHFTIEYGLKNIFSLHSFFNMDVANTLFNTLVVYGDAHIQLATCSLLVRMCCFQSWWGDFLANTFCTLFSSQNSKIFPQDRVFFLLTYLGRRSIAMGTCRSIVIDSILKTVAKLVAPISPRYNSGENSCEMNKNEATSLWTKSDLQLITWLLLFLSVCLDESSEKKDKSANRWEFMSCEADFTKSRSQTSNSNGKNYRSFKKRIIQQPKYTNFQQYTDWGKKIYMIQNELPEIFMELTGKPKPKISKVSMPQKVPKETPPESENYFDRGLKSIRLTNIIIVIRGLIALILEMDFTCNMDLFLLTCKVIARLVSACRPSIQLPKVVTTNQLEQLIRLAVWNDQQQPWAVHAVTCLIQDLLDADKNYKEVFESGNECSEINAMEGVIEAEEIVIETTSSEANQSHSSHVVKDISYADTVKCGQLPSLIECEDADIDIDEFLNDIDIVDRGKNLMKKDNLSQNKNSFNFFCKSISSALDARLDCGLDTNVEICTRRLTMISSLDMYASLPQIPTTELINTSAELPVWPEYITNIWSGPEYNGAMQTYKMFIDVFENIFADLHIQDTWVHLEQVLQMWLTLNSELSEKPYSLGLSPNDVPKIPFGPNAVQGLLLALAWHNDIKIRTWCLGFQCLILACNSQSNIERSDDANNQKIGDIIIQDENFEKMLLRFFSGYGMSSPTSMKRCAGPTICKYLHELLLWLQMKAEHCNPASNIKKKLKDTLLNVILQLVQPGGAICNQQGPMDAQSQLVRDLISMQYDKADLTVAMHIIESVSFLVFNNISNAEKIQCQRTCDTNNSNNAFGSLFATVLGADNNKQNTHVSDNSLIISLLKLSASLVQTELEEKIKYEIITVIDLDMSNESQTDEIKAEQLNNDNKVKVPCVADTVLRHFPTMKRLLGSLSHSCSSTFTLLASSLISPIIKPGDHKCSLNEPQTTADAVFHLLMVLCEKSTQPKLAVQPIYQYLESNSSPRNILPRLQLSEPFLLYVLKVLETPAAVSVFAEMGGIKILCQNLIKCNKLLINMQPGLISLIMQHMTRNTKMKFTPSPCASNSASKKTLSQHKIQEGLINFAPFCTISADNNTAQSAEVLIQTPIASHRRARTPAWSYMFYPNESHVDLTITLPTAVLLKEIQLQPHLPTLASCPAAVALEISRDNGIGSIPFGQPLTTVGMTCIRLKLIKPEIATSVVLRLYRPKDSSSIGLTQISILGTTIFTSSNRSMCSNGDIPFVEDDSLAKTSVGWIRLLARCFSVATFNPDCKLSKLVITSAAEYSGFLEACCNLMNVMPLIPNATMQNLENVLLSLGNYNKTLGLTLIRTLLWNTTPQTYRVTNEAVCDLLYDLCIKQDAFSLDKVSLLLDWVLKLQQNFSNRTMRCTNPQSGFVKCIASILWALYSGNALLNLPDIITNEVFEACLYWIDVLEDKEPLKLAFDSLLCSFCYIKPEFFNKLLTKVGFVLLHQSLSSVNSIDRERESSGITDDNKEVSGSEWYNSVAAQNLQMLLKPAYLSTLAMACQSPLAVYQLVDSSLPKLLAHAIFEYCCSMSPDIRKMTSNSDQISVSSCLTDSDKAESCERCDVNRDLLIVADQVHEILDFFSECCSEGHMRDWLGSYQGTIFWKPLLELLCNYRPPIDSSEPLQQSFIRIERSTVNFLTRVSSCHPKNQETLTHILISVIRKPQQANLGSNSIISGFTRRIVLQILLENERILISVKSKMPLQRKDHSIQLVNNHPSKRINSYHLLFYLSTHTKCQEILQNCASAYSNIIPPINEGSQQTDPPATGNQKNNQDNDNRREILEGFGLSGYGMELLSVAAGVTAKDKRLKDVRNQAAALKDSLKDLPKFTRLLNSEEFNTSSNSNMTNCVQLIYSDCPDVILSGDTTISQILAVLYNRGYSLSTPCITLHLVPAKTSNDDLADESQTKAVNVEPLPSPLQRFSTRGGLSLLAHYLPVVYPDGTKPFITSSEKEKMPQVTDWVKVDNEDIYEDIEDAITETTSRSPSITSVPQHSLAAFGLFLRLPAYSDILLRDKLKAQCLLRLVLGVTGDGEGNDIYSLSLAPTLPTLPFEVFRQLLDNSPLTTDDGVLLRRMVIDVGAMHLILNCLGIFTHQSHNYQIMGPQNDVTSGVKSLHILDEQMVSDDKSHIYWAKGTGFGTGSTQQSWDVEQALLRQKSEEEHVTVLLQVLSSYINPGDKIPSHFNCDDIMNYHEISDVSGELPSVFLDLLQQSCLVPALSSYLRNDSVLDITRHIPLYRSILQLLRAVSLSNQLVSILQPGDRTDSHMSITALLTNMKTCVDTYAKRLKVNKKSNIKGQTQKVTVNLDDGDDEGLALLIPDIQETTALVQKSTNADLQTNHSHDRMFESSIDRPLSSSIEQRYLEIMKKMQFDTYEMIVESENGFRFAVSHHFENNIRMAGDRGHPSRVKRLAQEAVTLSTSLPLSYSSSVFVRCDADRLDIMKVLITGPADTPYANGCFEFDVYFPSDYPNSPMLINLETTGRHSVRFNPNLYNDGKVCLSVLNTWHGRPEEKWNAQTSSFLQVLVSIQSLILVPEPYFNEPGFERSRGTPSGTHCSREYNSNIYQACVRWAMLEQIRSPNPCFKEVIHTHFWLKRHEICTQIENWIEELSKPQYSERSGRTISFNSMVLRRQYRQLREELAKLSIPEGLEDLDRPFNPNVTSLSAMTETSALSNHPSTPPLNQIDDSPESPSPPPTDLNLTTMQQTEESNQDQDNSNDDNVVSIVSIWDSEVD